MEKMHIDELKILEIEQDPIFGFRLITKPRDSAENAYFDGKKNSNAYPFVKSNRQERYNFQGNK